MYYLYLIGRFFSLLLPRGVAYKIAEIAGSIRFRYAVRDRRTLNRNLLPFITDRRQLGEVTQQIFVNFGYYLIDFCRYKWFSKKFLDKYVRIIGSEYLDKAVSLKKGIIFLTAHLGNYELAGAVLSLINNGLYAVALPHKDKRINDFFNYQRGLVKIKVIPTGLSVKHCIKLLRDSARVGFLGDRIFADKGIQVPLLGRTAVLPQGPASFASITDSLILPVFLVRRERYYYDLFIEEPIDCAKQQGLSKEDIVHKYSAILIKYIQKYPQQWYMFGDFWVDNQKTKKQL